VRLLSIVLPGLPDRRLDALSGSTPLEVARHEALDRLAARGQLALVELGGAGTRGGSVHGLPSLLGYDPARIELRRGPLEAAGLGVELAPGDLALRLNFVSTDGRALADTRAGHVSDREAALLLDDLRRIDLRSFPLRLHAGSGYRHLAVTAGGARLDLRTEPPQSVLGLPLRDHWPAGRDAAPLVDFLEAAARVLPGHEVNRVRVDLGENPADAAWLWGEGTAAALPKLPPSFGAPAAIVAGAPLVRGLGRLAGMDVRDVVGATADEGSDLAAKVGAALAALEDHAFVLLHVAAVNEASRSGDPRRKLAAIERVDAEIVAPLLEWVEADLEERRLLVTSDHATSVETRVSADDPVPFALIGGGLAGVRARRFTEESARASDLRLDGAPALLELFTRGAARAAGA
jgi:2,3-bisphosphoglycerate-independent phosphoglycerate mutase